MLIKRRILQLKKIQKKNCAKNWRRNQGVVKMVKKFIMDRLSERTTLDGAVLIGAGVAFLIFKPIASLVAYGAIAYGAWTLFKKES